MEVVKSATRLRKMYEEPIDSKYMFTEENNLILSFMELYDRAASIASWLIENNLYHNETAIIGRNASLPFTSYVSCYTENLVLIDLLK